MGFAIMTSVAWSILQQEMFSAFLLLFTGTVVVFLLGLVVGKNHASVLSRGATGQRESDMRYSALVEALPSGIEEIDTNGKLTFVSNHYADMMGYTREQLLGQNLYMLIPYEDREQVWADIQGIMANQPEPELYQHRFQRKDGSIFDAEVNWNYKRNDDGSIVGFTVIISDISNRLRAEKSLRDAQNEYQRLVDNIGAQYVVYSHRPDGIIDYVSKGMETVFGISPKEAVGKKYSDIISWYPASLELFTNYVNRMLDTGKDADRHQMFFDKPDGSFGVISVAAHPVVNEQGVVTQIEGIVEDITLKHIEHNRRIINQKRLDFSLELSTKATHMSEQDIFRSGLEYSQALSASEIAYLHFIQDNQETFEFGFWSEATLETCDAHNNISEAGNWADSVRMLHPVIHNDYQASENRKGYPQGQNQLKRHMSVPVVEDDKVRMVVGVGNKSLPYDQTDAEQLMLLSEEIWRIVKRRRTEIELVEARRVAESASRSKSSFLANMSHELRTPLNAILGFCELLLLDKNLNERQHKSIDTIMRSGEHLLEIINEVLDLSRIESGRLELEPAQFHFESMLENVISMLKVRAEEKGLDMTMEAGELPEWILADEKRLKQVLLNLLGNAIKYSFKGVVKLHIFSRLQQDVDGRVQIVFAVEDHGPGIPGNQIERIQKPFEQLRSNETHVEGTGLGISITASILEMMGSRLCLASKVENHSMVSTCDHELPVKLADHGTLVWFRLDLPIIESAANAHVSASQYSGPKVEKNAPLMEPVPGQAQLQSLKLLIESGRIQDIRDFCSNIQPEYPEFAAKILSFVEQFRLDELERYLQEHNH